MAWKIETCFASFQSSENFGKTNALLISLISLRRARFRPRTLNAFMIIGCLAKDMKELWKLPTSYRLNSGSCNYDIWSSWLWHYFFRWKTFFCLEWDIFSRAKLIQQSTASKFYLFLFPKVDILLQMYIVTSMNLHQS